MTVGYVTLGSSDDIHEWSGLNYHIRGALNAAGVETVAIDQVASPASILLRLRKRLYRHVLRKTLAIERSHAMVREWAKAAEKKLENVGVYDGIFSVSTLPIAFLSQGKPVTIWADATYHSLRSLYPGLADHCSESIRDGDSIERMAYERAMNVCFASDWAASDAISYYGVDPKKVFVVPYGANCQSPFCSPLAATEHVGRKSASSWKFLWLGVDWERKGGAIATDIVRQLIASGVDCVLTIVGCNPPGMFVNCRL